MIKFYFRSLKDNKLIEFKEFRIGSLVYVTNLNENDIIFLEEKLLLDKKTILDVLDTNEIPRLEIKNNINYIFLRAPVIENKSIQTTPILIVISSEFFAIIGQEIKIIDNLIRRGRFFTTQKTKLFLKILFTIFNLYEKIIIQINKKIRSSGLDLSNVNEKTVSSFVEFEIILQDLLTISLIPTKHIFSNILKKGVLTLFEKDKELLEDLILKIDQLEEISKASLKNITHIREAYEVILTNSVNKAIKFLTSLTVIIGLPTLIASLYGMNLKLPMENYPYAFFVILFLNIFLMIILLIYFNRKKWV
ncbi:MAG: hypothetical protein NZ866_03015 [Patescibacteria group bacterium]|nr:hypothetical protein [Patescibacteria group bacterium]